jgi:hypothetical protein
MTICYLGRKGSGKTLNMVKDLMEEMKEGRRVITNTPIKFKYRGVTLKSITIEDPLLMQKVLSNERRCIIGLDEAPTVLPANFWHRVSTSFARNLSQATQGWGHVIKKLRDLTDKVVVCKKRKFWLPRFVIHKKWDFIDKVTRKQPQIRWWYPLHAFTYSPELFARHTTDPRKIRQYQTGHNILYPSEVRRIGKCYSTTFFVEGSVLDSKTAKRDLDFKAELAQDVDPDRALDEANMTEMQNIIEEEEGKDY